MIIPIVATNWTFSNLFTHWKYNRLNIKIDLECSFIYKGMWYWCSEGNAGISDTDLNLPKHEGESVEYLVFQIEKKLNNSGVKFFYAFRFLKVIFMILHVYGCKTIWLALKTLLKWASYHFIKLVLVLHEVRICRSFRKKTGVSVFCVRGCSSNFVLCSFDVVYVYLPPKNTGGEDGWRALIITCWAYCTISTIPSLRLFDLDMRLTFVVSEYVNYLWIFFGCNRLKTMLLSLRKKQKKTCYCCVKKRRENRRNSMSWSVRFCSERESRDLKRR